MVGHRAAGWLVALAACGSDRPEAWDCDRSGSVCVAAGIVDVFGVNANPPLPLPAERAWLYQPSAIRPRADGTALIADCQSHRILELADGVVGVLAGTANHAYAIPGPALESPLENPCDVWPAADGGFLIAELHGGRILHVDRDGQLSVVLGTPEVSIGFSGDGGPALEAEMSDWIMGVIEGPDGALYAADGGNLRIRWVDPATGLVHTLAGDGELDGDDGPAATASFRDPRQMAWFEGDLLVADKGSHRVRRIDLDGGEVSTFAGTGEPGFSGEGGPAVDAALRGPGSVAVGPDGTVWIADSDNHVVRNVGADGRIRTVVGRPEVPGSGPDAGDVADAVLKSPGGLHVDADGRVWIADSGSSVIRVFVP